MKSSLERKERPSILKRVTEDMRDRFRLTDRDVAMVKAVYEYRALTAIQLVLLFFESFNSNAKRRLRIHFDAGLLFRDEQPSKLSEGRKPLVYFLDKRGAELLKSQGEEIDWHPKNNRVSYPFLQHLLSTNDIRIAFTLSARRHAFNLLTWLDDASLKSPQMKDRVFIKGEMGGKLRAAIVPDAYLRLDAGQDIYNFFLEVDRGTVTGEANKWGRRDWARKIKSYLQYYRSGAYERRYKTADMRVLTVTTSETRMSNLKAITEAASGKARFWFSTFERIKKGDILSDPLWSVAGRAELQAIIQKNKPGAPA